MSIDLLKQIVPIPNILSYDTFLFIGAHPDDIEIGAGGSVSHLISLGKKVYFLVITDGGVGSMDHLIDINKLVTIRLEEMKSSAEILGVKELFDIGLPDGGNYSVHEASIKIAKVILDTNPDVVICPDPQMPSEIHPDHIKAGLATNNATLLANYPLMAKRNLISFSNEVVTHFRNRVLAYYYTHRPNYFVSLDEKDILQRTKSIQLHQSQFQTNESLQLVLSYLSIRSSIFENMNQIKNAEGFFVMGPTHQHCFPEIGFY